MKRLLELFLEWEATLDPDWDVFPQISQILVIFISSVVVIQHRFSLTWVQELNQ